MGPEFLTRKEQRTGQPSKRKSAAEHSFNRKPPMARSSGSKRHTLLTEIVTKGEPELIKGPPGFEYKEPDDTVYFRWLNHVREVCFSGEVRHIDDMDLREETASRAVQTCCCEGWATLSSATPIGRLTLFDGLKAPCMPIHKYGLRLVQYLKPSPASIIAAWIYLRRVRGASAEGRLQPITFTTSNIHRLFLTALLIGCKFCEDE